VSAKIWVREDSIGTRPIPRQRRIEEAVTAEGNFDDQGVLHAQTIVRAKDSVALWPPDQ
jgi:hypothetical protein